MKIGVPKEIKDHETRVGLVPSGVTALKEAGHEVLVETGAGKASSFPDEDYVAAGAQIVPSAAEAWGRADLVVKVKEPQPKEYEFLRPGLVIFTYLHLAPLPELTEQLVLQRVNSVAYETIREADGSLPLLTPMSEVAGRMSIQVGAQYLERPNGGRGILLGGIPGVAPANVVIIGGIHAREWISPSTCMYFADNLIDRIKNDPAYANLMRRVAVYIIPSLNPDGYVYTWTNDRYWRKNRRNNGNGTRGVDLNRNYATGWGGQGSSSNTSSEIYRGPSPMSEPENQGLANLVQNLPNVVGFIDYHSYSQLIMWPWGYQSALCPDDAVHRFVGGRMRSAIFNYSGMVYQDGPINTTIYPASGTTVDWFYSPIGAISMTVELRDTGQYGFLLPESQILPTQQENWQAFQSFLFDVAVRRTSGVRK